MWIEQVPITHPDAVRLIAEVQEIYTARYGSPDESPVDGSEFEPPEGRFFLGYDDGPGGAPVATGAWRRSTVPALGSTRTAEIKRMFVVPTHQRRGLARQMLGHLETSAAAEGIEVLVLETGTKQPEAMAMYAAAGYEQVPGFGHYQGSPLSRCFARRLVASPA
ncbi:GNAT family N-acetyltransferase [Marmoricola endophyticus]|uniref:GNAT family N-acetyltransferase n=1 Tax=Marmoricola endophyticus TaxID=2040280 RepID=UPI00166834CC|nr:GNAT family N-acetyltransferase [Marmoricola endophyticus]